jgi:ParB-like chromosome segregation protein Spo0J
MQTLSDDSSPSATPDSGLAVRYLPVNTLRAYSNNARTHTKHQIRLLADSIKTFRFTAPILIDAKGTIVAGHARADAAKLLGLEQVPTICLDSLSPAQVRAYVIADNRLAEISKWNPEILKIEMQHLIVDTEIDIAATGFEVAEIDLILKTETDEDADDEFRAVAAEVITAPGDLWLLGEHRLLCGDAREQSSLSALMQDKRAAIAWADVPFNVAIQGHASGNGKTRHKEFAMASGEMTKAEFTEFLTTSLSQLAAWSTDGSIHYICMDWRHMSELLTAGEAVYDSLLNVCVWAKDVGGMGSFYRSRHEMIFVFKKGNGAYRNNIQLGRFGRNRTNVWNYPGANTLSRTGDEGNLVAMHPTVKPTQMVADALLDASARGEIVLDSFLGSGSTLLAAERVGRICYGMEIEPQYVDLAIRRWQKQTGERAIHAGTRLAFDELAVKESIHA